MNSAPAVESILEGSNSIDRQSEPKNTSIGSLASEGHSSTERLSPRQEYVKIAEADYVAKEAVYEAKLSVTQRIHKMASKLWGLFNSEDQEDRARFEKELTPERIDYLFETDHELQVRRNTQLKVEIDSAIASVNEKKYSKIPNVEKSRANGEVKVGRTKALVADMVRARAQWINLHFDGDGSKETTSKMNKLNNYQFDQMGKLREVYDMGQAYFDYETCKLQKEMLRGRLYEYFNTQDATVRGNMRLSMTAALDYSSDSNLRDIFANSEMSVEEKVEVAMMSNRQDSNMEYLKTKIEPGMLSKLEAADTPLDEE
jgi:hypothetical protein